MRRLVLCGAMEVLACGERSHACRLEEVAAAVMAAVLLARLLAVIALVAAAAVSLRALSYCCCRCLSLRAAACRLERISPAGATRALTRTYYSCGPLPAGSSISTASPPHILQRP